MTDQEREDLHGIIDSHNDAFKAFRESSGAFDKTIEAFDKTIEAFDKTRIAMDEAFASVRIALTGLAAANRAQGDAIQGVMDANQKALAILNRKA